MTRQRRRAARFRLASGDGPAGARADHEGDAADERRHHDERPEQRRPRRRRALPRHRRADRPSHYLIEDWISLGFFWLLGLCVFYQFFTRYVLNDSAAWTEEIARYLLICTVFVGVAAAVRRTRHIHVDFLYRLIPAKAGRALSTLVDVVRIVFFAVAVVLTIEMMTRMGSLQMTIIDLPMNLVYGVCAVGLRARLRSARCRCASRTGGAASACSSGPSTRSRRPSNDDERHARSPQSDATAMTGALLTSFLALMVTGIPVAIAMAGASLIYIMAVGQLRRRWWSSTG